MIKKPQQSGHLLYVLKYRQIPPPPPRPPTLIHLPTYLPTYYPPEGGRKLQVLNNLIIPQILGRYLRPTKVKGRAFNGADERATTTKCTSISQAFLSPCASDRWFQLSTVDRSGISCVWLSKVARLPPPPNKIPWQKSNSSPVARPSLSLYKTRPLSWKVLRCAPTHKRDTLSLYLSFFRDPLCFCFTHMNYFHFTFVRDLLIKLVP
jgi:hypothetical protein